MHGEDSTLGKTYTSAIMHLHLLTCFCRVKFATSKFFNAMQKVTVRFKKSSDIMTRYAT